MKTAAALAALGLAAPALAAPVASPTPPQGRALLLIPLKLTKVDDLSFGSVIPSSVSGTVAINPVTGARTFAGGVAGVPSDIGQRAYFAGAGSANRQVIVWAVPPTVLTSGAGDTISVLSMSLDGPPLRTISATQSFFFGVCAVINNAANQPEGVYTATFDVQANYL
jgi:hypothetical protein